jgi:anti-sigma factor RsiW
MRRVKNDQREGKPGLMSDRAFWQRCCVTDAPEDDAEGFLDLAGYVDGLLDPDDRDRVAARLAGDLAAAADVAAARAIAGCHEPASAELERIIARACAIPADTAPAGGRVIAFGIRPRRRGILPGFAQWGSLAAAIAIASWLGFAMGSDASFTLNQPSSASETSFLPELFDTGTGFLHDLGEGLGT